VDRRGTDRPLDNLELRMGKGIEALLLLLANHARGWGTYFGSLLRNSGLAFYGHDAISCSDGC
jgi:hypothetical protein